MSEGSGPIKVLKENYCKLRVLPMKTLFRNKGKDFHMNEN
jgi:hypothetical protein